LRALVIVLALTPFLRPIGRRIAGWLQGAAWLASLFALDLWVAAQTTPLATEIVRGIGDIVCFGGFFVLGMSGHSLRYRLSRRRRVSLAAGFFGAAVAWAIAFPPADWVVNNSYVLFGLVGLAWLCGLLALEDHLRHIGEIAPIRRFVGWITDRAMSIYLWHTVALVFAYQLVGAPRSLAHYVMLGAVFVVLLTQVVAAVRPLEAIGGKRTSRSAPVRPARVALLTMVLALLAGQTTLFPTFTEAAGPPTPSGRPPLSEPSTAEPSEAELQAMARSAEAWLGGHDVDGLAVVEIGPDTGNAPASAQFGDPDSLDPDAPFEALSLTKTMVAAVALQLVDEGVLTLDGPLPDVPGVPRSATEQLTLRRLLSHSSGLDDYREMPGYRNDIILNPTDAVLLGIGSAGANLATPQPPSYAATNYLLAGLVIEQVTRQPLSDVLQQRLFEPLGMDDTELVNNQREGFVGHGSGGIVSTLDDLARWYDALMRVDARAGQVSVLSVDMRHEMLFGGMAYQGNAGLGSWRHCPCDPPTVSDPEPFLYAFHDGGDVRLVYIPSRDVVLAMRFSTSLYGPGNIVGDIDDVIFAVADRRG
jgi:CubicO group peptidase (beta-lactamase class C family)